MNNSAMKRLLPALLLATFCAQAREIYVSMDGSAAEPYDAATNGFTSLSSAYTYAKANGVDTIRIAPGAYSVGATCVQVNGGLFTGCVVSNIIETWSWSDISLARVTGGMVNHSLFTDSPNVGEAAVIVNGSGAVVSNCVVRGITPKAMNGNVVGTLPHNMLTIKAGGGLVTHCIVADCGSDVVGPGNNGWYGIVSVKGGALRNTLVYGNRAYSYPGLGVTGGTVENCTVVGGITFSAVTGQDLYMSGGTIRNSIITGHAFRSDGGIALSSGNIDHSLVARRGRQRHRDPLRRSALHGQKPR